MKIIGITGGIGSGKSTVAGFLAEMGAVVIDADDIGHEILEKDGEARRQVIDTFGQSIVAHDGSVDRKKLGDFVFGNNEALLRLNEIMHPEIDKVVEVRLKEYRRQGVDRVVIEAPLLIEAGWGKKVDQVWVTTAPQAVILERLGKKGIPPAEAMARIYSQMADEERKKYADTVINTDCSLEELKEKASRLWRQE
ncbi:MAG TPA: dephospho-CoA kinase [Dehalococcoidia bacterium]|nr:dephospho-CoA kinase [Dehalococcoidia bacterium]